MNAAFRVVIALLLLVPWVQQGRAQGVPLSTTNKTAEKRFHEAIDHFQAKRSDLALENLQRALSADRSFTEAYILMGDVLCDLQEYEQAISAYQSAINTGKPFSPMLYYVLASVQLSQGFFTDAKFNFQRFLENAQTPENVRQQAEKGIQMGEYALGLMTHPVAFEPVNLGDSINSPYDDYMNIITADETTIYLTRKRPIGEGDGEQRKMYQEDFFLSTRKDSAWSAAIIMGPPVNTNSNEGALTVSPDGNFLFFAACDREDGYGSCDLYWAKRSGDQWSIPQNLGPVVNSPQWDSQPSFSSDGKTLYFASKRPGGKGSSDLWKTTLNPDGQWSVPVNLGDSVNTPAEEMSPFIHADDQTLYFASRGHPGMGGFDLYFTRKNGANGWKHSVNLGYPINTVANEITLTVNALGNTAYISSDMKGGKGKQDIYSFPLYPSAQPLPVTYLKGRVFDIDTGEKLEAAFELIDLETRVIAVESKANPVTGEFLVLLPSGKDYALNVSKPGYLFYSEHFSLKEEDSLFKPEDRNIGLKRIKTGESVVLKNIFFETGQYTLKEASTVELEKLETYMKTNPSLKIEIGGHTDNVGGLEYNMELSANRANAVCVWLTGRGIDPERLTCKGYGMSRPVASNETEEGRAMNRRTEFKITGN
ncbi:MAG TPA: OmpA family protein [Bacteroidales bacterium]|nr:OmpA family protein [Bacteroidales bacterium]HPT10473.1 OmpA family protein [Bacteroidales bacterium]